MIVRKLPSISKRWQPQSSTQQSSSSSSSSSSSTSSSASKNAPQPPPSQNNGTSKPWSAMSPIEQWRHKQRLRAQQTQTADTSLSSTSNTDSTHTQSKPANKFFFINKKQPPSTAGHTDTASSSSSSSSATTNGASIITSSSTVSPSKNPWNANRATRQRSNIVIKPKNLPPTAPFSSSSSTNSTAMHTPNSTWRSVAAPNANAPTDSNMSAASRSTDSRLSNARKYSKLPNVSARTLPPNLPQRKPPSTTPATNTLRKHTSTYSRATPPPPLKPASTPTARPIASTPDSSHRNTRIASSAVQPSSVAQKPVNESILSALPSPKSSAQSAHRTSNAEHNVLSSVPRKLSNFNPLPSAVSPYPSYSSPRKRGLSNHPNISTSPLPSPVPPAPSQLTLRYSTHAPPADYPLSDTELASHSRAERRSIGKERKDMKYKLHELFARDKWIKWVWNAQTNVYEPVFVIVEDYGPKKQVIARDYHGHYNAYTQQEVVEAPPYDKESTLVSAVEQILKGYQLRFKATSLRKQTAVEVMTGSSSVANTLSTHVVGYQVTGKHLSKILLQDDTEKKVHSFPTEHVQEKHVIHIETNGVDIRKHGSEEHKVNEKDMQKQQQFEKQQHELMQQMNGIHKETKKLQREIMHKVKAIEHKASKFDKTQISTMHVLCAQILKRNKYLELKSKAQKEQIQSWMHVAAERKNENCLLKEQMLTRRTNSKQSDILAAAKLTDHHRQEAQRLQQKLREIMDEQKANKERIRTVQSENVSLQKKLKQLESQQSAETPGSPDSCKPVLTESDELKRTGGLQIDSKFCTTKEVLAEFQSLRDQEYHNLHSEIKKSLKEIKSKSWHKLYINQTCHQFMFELLQISFKTMKKYHDSIYQRIGALLCIQKLTSDKAEQQEKLNYVFHFYLQENHCLLFEHFKMTEFEKLIDKTQSLYNKRTQCHLSADAYLLLSRYLRKCCNVSWLMILQRPMLALYPSEFKPALQSVVFDEATHSKVMGSDRKSKHVLYFVWPTIRRGNKSLDIQAQVVLRDSDVAMNKKR